MSRPHAGVDSNVIASERAAGRFTLGFLTLDNSSSLNAIDLGMFEAMERRLAEWRARDDVACIVLHAASDRAFCAGGDVKELAHALAREGAIAARKFFSTEYFVDYLIHVYPKPILCWADGIAMGGGIGIMNGASYRVVTERSILAMPEIALGLFPDVGATYFFNRLPAGLGLFLGLTGARFDGYDALAIGMADGLIAATKKPEVFTALEKLSWTASADQNQEVLRSYLTTVAEPPAAMRSALAARLETVQRLTLRTSLEEIDAAFRSWNGADDWIRRAIDGYLAGSPTSVKTTFRQLTDGKRFSLKEAFLREWNLAFHLCQRPDFREGIRARLIDKDQRPHWSPPGLAAVRDEEIDRFFSPVDGQPNALAEKFIAAGLG